MYKNTSDIRKYNELVDEIANWNVATVPSPNILYRKCDEFVKEDNSMVAYGIILKHYLLLKAGHRFRIEKEEFFGSLKKLTNENKEYSPAAHWILARYFASQIPFVKSLKEKHDLVRFSYNYIKFIKSPINVKYRILLPGIRSETTPKLLLEDFDEQCDPKVTVIPVPYRYLMAYALSLADFESNINLKSAIGLINEAKYFSKLSAKNMDRKYIYLSTQIEMSSNIIDVVSACSTNESVHKGKMISKLELLLLKLELYISQHQLPENKANEWITTCYASIAALTKSSSSYDSYLKQFHSKALDLTLSKGGQVDFFMIDSIYKLAHKGNEYNNFQNMINNYNITIPDKDVAKDIFICHCSEDKDPYVNNLYECLKLNEINCWFDDNEIRWGDNFVSKINEGLRVSKYVLVVLSINSIKKNWPQFELDASLSVELSTGKTRVLPLLLGNEIEINQIREYYPLLSSKVFAKYSYGLDEIVKLIKNRLS